MQYTGAAGPGAPRRPPAGNLPGRCRRLTIRRITNTQHICPKSCGRAIRYPGGRGGDKRGSLEIRFQGIVVIVGNYGSGKTEVAINLALASRQREAGVRVVDLDLVNPYFRTREARDLLRAHDVEMVLPPAPYLHADLPILSPAVSGAIRRPGKLTLLDVGGDDAGATVLASLADAFEGQPIEMLQVINPYRPHTESVAGCLAMRREIEAASRLAVTGWIGNAHLMEATTTETITAGFAFASEVSRTSGLPLAFITAPRSLLDTLPDGAIDCPVLPIERRLIPPWQRAATRSAPAAAPSGGPPKKHEE